MFSRELWGGGKASNFHKYDDLLVNVNWIKTWIDTCFVLKTIAVTNTSVPLGDFDACVDFTVNILLLQSCLFWQKWKETCGVVCPSLDTLNEVGECQECFVRDS